MLALMALASLKLLHLIFDKQIKYITNIRSTNNGYKEQFEQ